MEKTCYSDFVSFCWRCNFDTVGVGAYKRGRPTCARTWGSKRGGGLFSEQYGTCTVESAISPPPFLHASIKQDWGVGLFAESWYSACWPLPINEFHVGARYYRSISKAAETSIYQCFRAFFWAAACTQWHPALLLSNRLSKTHYLLTTQAISCHKSTCLPNCRPLNVSARLQSAQEPVFFACC
jgi:hypothetical protein